MPTTRLDLSQLLMSSLGPIPQRLVLLTFPCVDYISRGNTGGLHSRPPSSNVGQSMPPFGTQCCEFRPKLFTPSARLCFGSDTLSDMPDRSRWSAYSSRPLPSWTADKFTLIVAKLDDGASRILLSMLGPSMRCPRCFDLQVVLYLRTRSPIRTSRPYRTTPMSGEWL